MSKARRAADVNGFQDIPNIGPAMAADFALLGLAGPRDLIGRDPLELYDSLCRITKTRQDPCVLDVFIAAVRFMEGGKPKVWWHYTPERKRLMAAIARGTTDQTRGSARRASATVPRKSRGRS